MSTILCRLGMEDIKPFKLGESLAPLVQFRTDKTALASIIMPLILLNKNKEFVPNDIEMMRWRNDWTRSVNNALEFAGVKTPVLRKMVATKSRRHNGLANMKILALTLVGMLSLAVPAFGEQTQAGGDFSFKRVGVPDRSSAKRITVQIDPNAQVFRITPGFEPRRPGDPRPDAALETPPGVQGPQSDPYAWYWAAVSPAIDADPALRFQTALAAIERGDSRLATPRLQTLKRISDAHGVDILTSTIGTKVSPALVLAVIAVESAGQADAVSHAGAQGLMQLMPATARRFGVSDSTNPRENIRGGVAYLDWLLKEFRRDPVLALAGYNAGEGAVAKHEGVPPYSETRGYVPKVLAAWNVARGLCVTRPQLITDGCVFVGPTIARNEE